MIGICICKCIFSSGIQNGDPITTQQGLPVNACLRWAAGEGVAELEDNRPYLFPVMVIERNRMGDVGRKPKIPDVGEPLFLVTVHEERKIFGI